MTWIPHPVSRASRYALPLSLALFCGSAANAVLHVTGDGSGNTQASPPPDDPGIDNVGSAQGLTAVYLGGGWVLSADHVGEKDLTLLGTTYSVVPGSHRQLDHSPTRQADLALYRIQGSPPLPSLKLAESAPIVGEEVVAVGNGYNREPPVIAWNASWIEVPLPGTFRGYKRLVGSAIRWGRNEIDGIDLEFDVSGRLTQSFVLTFDEVGLPDEMQAVTKDSGGGVFVKRGGEWELAGILFLQLIPVALDGQPIDTAVFGDLSGVVDVFFYRDQILAIMNPQIPASGAAERFVLALTLLAVGAAMIRLRPARERA